MPTPTITLTAATRNRAPDAATTAHRIADEADTRLAAVAERYEATASRLTTLLLGAPPAPTEPPGDTP